MQKSYQEPYQVFNNGTQVLHVIGTIALILLLFYALILLYYTLKYYYGLLPQIPKRHTKEQEEALVKEIVMKVSSKDQCP